MSAAPEQTVEVVESERIVARGNVRTEWHVQRERSWIKAAQWPGAVVKQLDSGPGTVWERAIRVALPVGATLMRVETRPRATPRRDPMAYLRGAAPKAPASRREDVFTVRHGGALELRRRTPRAE